MTPSMPRTRTGNRLLSVSERRTVWLGALVVAPVLAWRLVVTPYLAGVQQANERVATARELLSREKALVRDAPLLPARARRAAERLADVAPRLFDAADTVASTAALASWVREAARATGLHVTQSDAAPVEMRAAGVAALAVDARVEGSFGAVVEWLDLLESGERALAIERFDVVATGAAEGTIAASARVRGFAVPLRDPARGRRQ